MPSISTDKGSYLPGETIVITITPDSPEETPASLWLEDIPITMSGETTTTANGTAPAESTFAFGQSFETVRWNTNLTLRMVFPSGAEAEATIQVDPDEAVGSLEFYSANSGTSDPDSLHETGTAAGDDIRWRITSGVVSFDTDGIPTATTLPAVVERVWYDVSVGIWSAVDTITFPAVSTPAETPTDTRQTLPFINATNPVEISRQTYHLDSGNGEPFRLMDKFSEAVSALDFMTEAQRDDVVGRTALVDVTAAIMAADTYLHANGRAGGVIFLPPGKYLVSNQDADAASWDNDVALWFKNDNTYLIGAGPGATVITLANSSDSHVIKFGQRVTSTVTVARGGVIGIEIDGNRANQTAPTASNDHWSAIDVATGCTGLVFENLYLHDCQYYGIGFQREGFRDCRVRDVLIEDCGADGIDAKDDADDSTANLIENVTVRRPGLAGALSNQAGVDVRGGWNVRSVTVEGVGSNQCLTGVRCQESISSPQPGPAYPSTFSDLVIVCDRSGSPLSPITDTVGYRSSSKWARLCGATIFYGYAGARISADQNECSKVTAISCRDGIQWQTGGDRGLMEGCIVRGATNIAYRFQGVDGVVCNGNASFQSATGVNLDGSCSNVVMQGGTMASNTVAAVSDSGTNTRFSAVGGIKTENRVQSGTFAIDSTGIKTVTITHGLAFTPAAADCQLTIIEQTDVDDWGCRWVKVDAVSSTTVTAKVNVSVASATGAATARLGLYVRVKT